MASKIFYQTENCEKQLHKQRPETSVLEENIRVAYKFIDSGQCIKISEIASVVGISSGNAQSIINNNVNYWESVGQVSSLSPQEQKHDHLDVKAS